MSVSPFTDMFRNYAYVVAACPSSKFSTLKKRHYEFLRVCWHLNLVSLFTMRKLADALQERTA